MPAGLSCSQEKKCSLFKVFKGVTLQQIDLLLSICLNQKSLLFSIKEVDV